jgi:multidrug efflux pump subunit AcrB
MKDFLARLYSHTVFATMMTGFILLGGIASLFLLVREGIPEIQIGNIMVATTYLGADPYEVEEGIARKIEEAIDGLEGIDRYTTVSIQNRCQTAIQIIEGYPMTKALDNIRNAIDAISTFPPDAEKPIISELTIRREVLLVALWGDVNERVAKETAETLKDELQALPEISQVSISGVREYEIAIELSEEKMRQWGLSFQQVSQALRAGSVNLSGGTLRTRGEEIDIKAVGRKYTGEELSKIVVVAKPTGEIITLGQIANVRDAFTEDDVIARFNGKPAVMIGVFKTDQEDAITVANAARKYVEKKAPTLPAGIHLTAWSDNSEDIQARIHILVVNGLQGLCVVLLILWLFMDTRLSLWVAMGIPASISGSLMVLYLFGGSLNIMSLLGMILVMGMLVDDGIVVSEAIYYRRWNGEHGVAAATHGAMEVGLPVIGAVTTTIVAFIPLFFIPSVVGKFVAIVPVVVIACLCFSVLESLTCLPAHLSHLPDPHTPPALPRFLRTGFYIRRAVNGGLAWALENWYKPFIHFTLRYRYVVLASALAFFVVTFGGLVGGGFVKFVLFPAGDIPFLQASVEFPQGTPLDVTVAALKRTEDALVTAAKEAEVEGHRPFLKHIYTIVGQGTGDLFDYRAVGSFTGIVRVELTPGEERDIHAREIVARWQKATGAIPGAVVQAFGTREQGPPGAPIQIWLKGENFDEMVAGAQELKTKLKSYGGLFQIADDYRSGNRELKIDLKPEARGLGLTLDDLASQVYAGFYGAEAMRVQRGRDDIRVKVRYSAEERNTLADLEQVRIRTRNGQEVPFFSVANVKFGRSVANVTRVDGRRTIAVSADVDEQRANAEEVLADLQATFMPAFEAAHPSVAWSFEGAKQDSNKAFKAVMIGFPIALLGIFVIVATIFRSYLQPLVVMISIPFGMTGAIYGHWFMGMPLTMFSVFGMVALAGVVVNDSIVLIDAINIRLGSGMDLYNALADAGARRFRAILMTTTTTIGGMGSLIFSNALAAQGMIPMALSLCSGLAVSSAMTLVLVPSLLAIVNDGRRAFSWSWRGRWPTREEVEPGSKRAVDRYLEDLQKSAPSEPALVK